MQKITLVIALILGLLGNGNAQAPALSDASEVSMITCSPADELYALFGHSAIRVYDPSEHIDLVFNYGTFDFSVDNFYLKFAKGQLDYELGISSYSEFLYVYQVVEKRTIYEQVLNLDIDQRQKMFDFLVETYNNPQTRKYRYDFFYDNCATRVWEAVEFVLGGKLKFAQHEDANKISHRKIIGNSLDSKPWAHWGIDLILGSTIDDAANNRELMFLPRYMMEIFAESKIQHEGGTKDLVREERLIHRSDVKIERSVPLMFTPNYLFWALFVIFGLLGFSRFKQLNDVIDIVLFEVMGLLGVLVFLMWFFTDHGATKANFNLLWMNPIHLLIPLLLLIKPLKPKMEKVFLALGIFHFAIFLFWIAIPQEMHPGFKPLILLLGIRYFFRFRRMKVSRLRS